MSVPSQAIAETDKLPIHSLAGPYLVQCTFQDEKGTWSLIPLAKVPTPNDHRNRAYKSEGARAWAALHSPLDIEPQLEASLVLECQSSEQGALLQVTAVGADTNLESVSLIVPVLSRLLAQWTISSLEKQKGHPLDQNCQIDLPGASIALLASDWNSDNTIRKLFATTTAPGVEEELVEMVDRHGAILGVVPRKLVHTHNLLHRGIGLFVTKDRSMSIKNNDNTSSDNSSENPPDDAFPFLYVHRRTDTKRIFPSLYDMFVGGVATAWEDSPTTALREVAEELGLTQHEHLSPLLDAPISKNCVVVCTAYNRCVVTLFAYQMDTQRESVSWQDEEVAWGAFVPYAIVRAAADRSILRLRARGEWPGSEPPVQSASQGAAPNGASYDDEDWTTWDFVPDGLLVWKAWLQWLDDKKARR